MRIVQGGRRRRRQAVEEVADRRRRVGGHKQRALLALLLLHANEVVHAERLIDELWSGEPPESAAKSLQVYVSRLRKQLGDGALRTRAGGYVLEVAEGEVDLDRFRATLDRGRRQLAAGDPEAAAETLATALALWCGPPLADFRYDSFAQFEITRLGSCGSRRSRSGSRPSSRSDATPT
jgi:DNA-binding SARP family transcriptional activator